MAPKGSIGRLYYVSKRTPRGGTYQNAFLRKDDAQAWARKWVAKGATEVSIHYGLLSNAASSGIYGLKFKKIPF